MLPEVILICHTEVIMIIIIDGNRSYQKNLLELSKSERTLNSQIEQAFMSTEAYTDYMVEQERLGVKRQFTENLIPTLGAIGGGALFNMIGNKMFGGGGGGLMSMFGKGGGANVPIPPSAMALRPAVPLQQGLGPLAPNVTPTTAGMFGKTAVGTNLAFGNVAGAGMGSNISSALKSGGAITGGIISGLTSGFMEFSENKKLGISMGENVGRTTTKAISSGVGGWGGASLGAAIGTAIFPGVGTLVGGFIGGWLGGKGGDKLGEAINNGIYGDKQEKQLRVQQEMQLAQEKLQKDTNAGMQVDVDYYKKSLKLNEQQIAQLQQYNKTALDPKWLDNPPKWYLESGGRDRTPETVAGSGLKLPKGFEQGDNDLGIFGKKIQWVYEKESNIVKKLETVATAQDYIKAIKQETGKNVSESEIIKMIKDSRQGLKEGQIKLNADDPMVVAALQTNKYLVEIGADIKKSVEQNQKFLEKAGLVDNSKPAIRLAGDDYLQSQNKNFGKVKQVNTNWTLGGSTPEFDYNKMSKPVKDGFNQATITFDKKYERSNWLFRIL